MKILGIDTSSKTVSVAVQDGERLAGEITYVTRLTHSQVVLPLVNELLSRLELSLEDMDCIAVNEGPGSYTGLRIGVAAVKGMCFGNKTKCFGASSLMALANNVKCFDGVIAAVMHARPGIAYFGAYKAQNGLLSKVVSDKVCGYEEIEQFVNGVEGGVILVGDICEKLKDELFSQKENVRVAPASLKLQRAASLCELAYLERESWGFADGLDARYLQVTKAEKDREK